MTLRALKTRSASRLYAGKLGMVSYSGNTTLNLYATAPANRSPFSLSLRPFSPQAGNCANLVLSLGFEQNQAIRVRGNPAKFKSATGSREVLQMFSGVPRHYGSRGQVSSFLENNVIRHHAFAQPAAQP